MDDADTQKLTKLLSDARSMYNSMALCISGDCVNLDIKSVHEAVYDWARADYPDLPAQCVIRTYKEVLAALRSIKANKHEDPKVPERKHLAMRIDKRLYAHLTADSVELTGFLPRKRKAFALQSYPKLEEMFSKYETLDPLVFIRDGQPWLAISFAVPPVVKANNDGIGVDLGMKRFAVTSDGLCVDDKAYKTRRRKVRYLKRCLKAKNTKSAKRHLKRVKRKERHLSKDFIVRAVRSVLASTEAGALVLEDLKKIKQNTSKTANGYNRKKHNSAFSQVALSEFKDVLSYKAQLVGKRVETVSPAWTSQTDSRTGKRDGKRHGCRYVCSDGIVFDADWNAAVNILKKSQRPAPSVLPLDGQLRPLQAGHSQLANRGQVGPTASASR